MPAIALKATMHHDDPPNPSRATRDLDEEEFSDVEGDADVQHSLLNHSNVAREEGGKRGYEMTTKGRLRAYWLGIVVCIGGFLCKAVAARAHKDVVC